MPILLRRNILILSSILVVLLLASLPSSSSYSVPSTFSVYRSPPQCVAELSDISGNTTNDVFPFEFEALTTVNDFDPASLRPPPPAPHDDEHIDDIDLTQDLVAEQGYNIGREHDELDRYIADEDDDDFLADEDDDDFDDFDGDGDYEDFDDDEFYDDDDAGIEDPVFVKTDDGQIVAIERAEFEAGTEINIEDADAASIATLDIQDTGVSEDEYENIAADDTRAGRGRRKAASLVYANHHIIHNATVEIMDEYDFEEDDFDEDY